MLAAEPRRRFSVIGDWERVPRVSVQRPVTVAQRGGHRSGTALSDWLTVERCDCHHTAGGAGEEDLLRAAKRARGYVTDPHRPSEVVGDLDRGPSSDPLSTPRAEPAAHRPLSRTRCSRRPRRRARRRRAESAATRRDRRPRTGPERSPVRKAGVSTAHHGCAYVATDQAGVPAEARTLFPYVPYNQPRGVLDFYRKARAANASHTLWVRLQPADRGTRC